MAKFLDSENREILHKEIDLVQSVISRMASNSFMLKGWMITLVSVILALNKDTIVATDYAYFNAGLVFVIAGFWYLDGFYLHLERCYRRLYAHRIALRKEGDLSNLYSLDYRPFVEKETVFKVCRSKTLGFFYGIPFFLLSCLLVYNYCN